MSSRCAGVLVIGVLGVFASGTQTGLAAPVPLSRISLVTAGEGSYALALRQDGTVLGWGNNTNGTLGNGTTNPSLTPTPVLGLGTTSAVVALAPSLPFALALEADGTVLGWGVNTLGQLGDGTLNNALIPVQTSGLGPGSGVIAIAAGLSHAVAVKSDGSVWAWGSNNSNNLGNPSVIGPSTVPVPVSGLGAGSGVVAVAAGGNFTLAMKADGTLWGWGNNNNGQLGIGNQVSQPVPVQVKGPGAAGVLTGVAAISAAPNAGGVFALALKADGTVWSWGNNANGQLGDGTATNRSSPVQVVDVGGAGTLTGVSAIDAGGTSGNLHSIAVRTDGTVLAWGSNANGQLGTGDHVSSKVPVQVATLGTGSGVVAVSAATGLSIARRGDGSVLSWGDNSSGQLGNGSFFGRAVPAQVAGLGSGSGVTSIASGNGANHSMAVRADGALLAWGNNSSGQLCTGDLASQPAPVVVTALTNVTAAAAGASHSLALTASGAVWACGDNSSGQLGTGTGSPASSRTPVQVRTSATTFLTNVIAIAAGASDSLALASDGALWAWGQGDSGQIGDGHATSQFFAVQVHGAGNVGLLGGVTAVATNGSASYALQSDGTVLGWGLNAAGQVGDGSNARQYTPVQVSGLGSGSSVIAIGAIAGGGAAVKADGTVVSWGLNASGQIGDGTTIQRATPVEANGLGSGSGVVGITGGGTVGSGQTLARKATGAALSWGANGSGQLGDGTVSAHKIPAPVLVAGVIALAGGATHSLALKTDGTVLAWGANGSGQLGDGSVFTTNLTPANVLIDDVMAPMLSAVSAAPSIVGISGHIAITANVSDADSGVSSVSATVRGPAPSSAILGSVPLSLQSGDAFAGVWAGTFTFPADTPDGTFTIAGSAMDVAVNSASATGGTVVLDRTAPTVTLASSVSILWPPNGKMVPVTFSGTIADATSGVDVTSATYVVIDEYGAVQPGGSIALTPDGRYTFTVPLEAFRNDDDLDGRQYRITVSVRDKAGNTGAATIVMIVPHDRRDRSG
jgi:alpha-tubulin suppressor-like RCC1 family protein